MGKQSKSKARKHAVDMSGTPSEQHEEEAAAWQRPDPDSCEETSYRSTPAGATADQERFVIRTYQVAHSYELVEFAMIYLTNYRGKWVEVAEIDSCHDDDVHLHQNGRRAGGRVSDAVPIAEIHTMDDVQSAYDLGLTRLEGGWRELKDRWHHD